MEKPAEICISETVLEWNREINENANIITTQIETKP